MVTASVRPFVVLGACLVALVAASGSPAQPAPAVPDNGRTIVAVAGERMQAILARAGTERDRDRVLQQNLSRYFLAYPLPTAAAEGARVVTTAERISRAFTSRLYRAAEARARASARDRVAAADVAAALGELLPQASGVAGESVVFPALAKAERVAIERIDLEALADTGFGWNALGYLVTHDLAADPAALALEPAAVEPLAAGVVLYGLTLLRLAGRHAGEDYAAAVGPQHLRQAEKTITTRAGAPPAGPETPLPGFLVDVTASSGLRFRHVTAEWLSSFRRYGPAAPTFSGGGVSAADLDGDGWPDLVLCGGDGCVSWRNQGDGTFVETTAASGLRVAGEARMALVADFDADGDPDVLVTYARDPSRLFSNRGDGTFTAVADSGLERPGDISGPAVAVDYDGDGRLDVYVCNFGDYLANASPWLVADSQNAQPNRLFRNLGGLRFVETTAAAGVGDTGWCQALSHVDHDADGDQDLYVANDFGSNELYDNLGDGTFRRIGKEVGADDPSHSMNVAFADLNRDRLADVFITNIWAWNPVEKLVQESNTLLLSRRDGSGRVRYEKSPLLDVPGLDTGWSWGGLFFDVDLDGDDDLYAVNGLTEYSTFVQYRESPRRPGELYPINNGREPNYFLRNEGGRFVDASVASGARLEDESSRGLALLDFDLDGDLDVAVTTFHGDARLFRNDAPPAGSHWLHVDLVGDPAAGVNLEAIGATLVARGAGGLEVWRAVTGGEGYLGSQTPRIELGLGAATEVDLEVTWPGGRRQTVSRVPADQVVRIRFGRDGFEVVPRPPVPRRQS
ncbi:MAG: CRTAC1 family protein [Thermoanaerobaculia bacterium]|nr:CRTAC1 family protein [Thermoanaerobaculia bacterium]